jgi:hypothetical protein
MSEKASTHSGPVRSITLRRDGYGALRFNGERIGAATRDHESEDDDGKKESFEISARLFKTTGGAYVVGVEVYNRTEERYDSRDGINSTSLADLVAQIKHPKRPGGALGWLDDDILGELFEKTEIADQFVEQID